MHPSTPVTTRRRTLFPLLYGFVALALMVAFPAAAVPLAFFMPILVCPAQISIGLWFSLLMPLLPCIGLALHGADFLLCVCLLPASYLCLLTQQLARRHKLAFSTTAIISAAAIMLMQALWWARVAALLGGDSLFAGLAAHVETLISQSPYETSVLTTLVQRGVLALPAEQQKAAYFLPYALQLSASLRQTLLTSLRFTLQDWLTLAVPSLLVQVGAFTGLMATLQTARETIRRSPMPFVVLTRDGKRRIVHSTVLLPSFQALRLPAAYRGHLLVLAVLSLVLRYLWPGQVALLASQLMMAAFSSVFYILGAATLMALLAKSHPERTALYGLLAFLLFLFFPTALLLLGLIDGLVGLRPVYKIHKEDE